jgi:cytochrome oxidase Cu insertion factor (SCO1/SenC/PrrC family)
MTSSEIKQSRRRLIVIALAFLLPVAIAAVIYYQELWRPAGSTNKGELVHPAKPLPRMALSLADGGVSKVDVLLGKWTWIYIGDGQCDERCKIALADTRQVRLLLAEKINRVQRVFLSTDHCCAVEFFAKEHPDLIVAKLDNAEFAKVFPLYNQVPLAAAGRIYLVDPLGNVMMSYAPNALNNDLLDDIKKLLKLSHIG